MDTVIGINKYITSKVNYMNGMFQLCQKLEYLDLSNFNTSNVIDMESMFNKCHKLKQIIGINKFNTSKVINMRGMFQLRNEIEYLDLTNFNTSNVIAMEYMFNECHKLKEIIGINKFNTVFSVEISWTINFVKFEGENFNTKIPKNKGHTNFHKLHKLS